MRIISKGTLKGYLKKYPVATEALTKWELIINTSHFENLNQIREIFNSVDYYGDDLYIFNIMGNKYRLIVRIFFKSKIVYVRFFGTHAEYDKVDISTL